ncbi:MAG: DUF2306 domain-containing protein [Bacteroidetes bacterium]|nr:DUF2306 domain-containing protein [Bacteroidota bacterium]
MKAVVLNITREFLVYAVLCLGTFGMLLTIMQYASFSTTVGFLAFKQDYINITVWKMAFYTHVFSSILVLCAGFTQFSNYVLKHHRNLHRIMGKVYAYDILFINFPAGMIMAVYANGLLPTKIAFVILDSLWFLFTLKAVSAIRKGNVKAHKQFMIRSFALSCSAVTLRWWKIVLSHSFHFDPLTLYMIDAWMGFVPNLLFAEWLIRRKQR